MDTNKGSNLFKYYNLHGLFLHFYYSIVCYMINQLTFREKTLQWMPTYLEMYRINLNVRSFQNVFLPKIIRD